MKLILISCFFTFLLIPCLAQEQITPTVKVSALVIGYSPLSRLEIFVGSSRTYFAEDVLIQVQQSGNNLIKGQYLRFNYERLQDEAKLPPKMFTKKHLWEFTMTRNQKCDVIMKDYLKYEFEGKTSSYLVFTHWALQEQLPQNENVPCYTLKAGNYKKY